MERKCIYCGAPVDEHSTICPVCGKQISETTTPNANPLNNQINSLTNQMKSAGIYTCGALLLAALLLVLSFITSSVDSASFINRMYTTALEWNLPLAAIALVVVAFVTSQRERKNQLLNLVAVAMLAVAFVFSNPNKNMVQDHISNLNNYVNVSAEAVRDNLDNVDKWMEKAQDTAEDIERDVKKAMNKSRHSSYNDYY